MTGFEAFQLLVDFIAVVGLAGWAAWYFILRDPYR